jgi:hypothetical protein
MIIVSGTALTPTTTMVSHAVPTATVSASAANSGRKWDAAPPAATEVEMSEDDTQLLVEIPEDGSVKAVIDLLAKFVSADGEAFEKVRAMMMIVRAIDNTDRVCQYVITSHVICCKVTCVLCL